MLRLERTTSVDRAAPLRQLGDVGGDTYCMHRGEDILWSVRVGFDSAAHVPFREELLWPRASVVAIGGGDRVYLLDLETGALRGEVAIPSLVGHLALANVQQLSEAADDYELLLILGWADVHALNSDLSTRWIARGVAVDGILFAAAHGQTLTMHAEMDPPGGWFEVMLNACDGRELSRRPAFTPGYVGLYGAASED